MTHCEKPNVYVFHGMVFRVEFQKIESNKRVVLAFKYVDINTDVNYLFLNLVGCHVVSETYEMIRKLVPEYCGNPMTTKIPEFKNPYNVKAIIVQNTNSRMLPTRIQSVSQNSDLTSYLAERGCVELLTDELDNFNMSCGW